MSYVNLRKQIIALANLPRCEEPIISAYLNLEQPIELLVEEFTSWVKVASQAYHGDEQVHFIKAAERIQAWLLNHMEDGRSAAIFCRSGSPDFFLPLTFQVPLENSFHADAFPAIFPLVELRDRFSRFVVVMTNRDSARIIELNLGETSLELLAERPEANERHGREWTREHYNSNTRERNTRFVAEKVEIIERLMSKRGHNALIMVGEAQYVNRLKSALPEHLAEKVVDQIRTGFSDQRVQCVLEDAIKSYLQVENDESETAVKHLFRAHRTNHLGLFGIAATARALQIGQVEELIISSTLCHTDREVLVRLASQHSVPIETVRNSELLDEQGGAGAILRYASPSYITNLSEVPA